MQSQFIRSCDECSCNRLNSSFPSRVLFISQVMLYNYRNYIDSRGALGPDDTADR